MARKEAADLLRSSRRKFRKIQFFAKMGALSPRFGREEHPAPV
jgi:hypothetical protein